MSKQPDEKKKKPAKPSEEFERAITISGGCVVTCEFCQRTYFEPGGGWDWEKGELESLRANAEKEPDKFIECDYSICDGPLDGKTYVVGCKCQAAGVYERWIWSHRHIFERYFAAMLKKRKILLDKAMEVEQAEIDNAMRGFGIIVESITEEYEAKYSIEASANRRKAREDYTKKHPPDESHSGAIYVRHLSGYDREDTYETKAAKLTALGFIRLRSEPNADDGGKYWETWWVSPWMLEGELQGLTLEDAKRWALKQGFGNVDIVRESWGLSAD